MPRRRIGPKVQTQVHPEIKKWVLSQVAQRGEREADVVRELIEAGYATKAEA